MEYDANGPVLNLLLMLGEQLSLAGVDAAFLPFPDGLLAFEHALQTLHSAVPSADTIYISLKDEGQKSKLQLRLDNPSPLFPSQDHSDDNHHSHHQTPKLEIIPEQARQARSGDVHLDALFAVHKICPDAKWLALGCDFPLLPPSALQQLVLEYRDPVTCFMKENGAAEPFLGIWASEALGHLHTHVESKPCDENVLRVVFEDLQGNLVKPLREKWIVTPRRKTNGTEQ
ncbi:hypothetical protein ONS96_006054 [Cadophora gregata f. sp. sojae]|nr:hypothetical protein ONS96_006054 [Cadophora gregata f. sp. sojae]